MKRDRKHDVVIVGAGLAGSAAAIVLSRAGYNVCLVDRSEFPRHKLCGEFLSHESVPLLEHLSVLDVVRQAGAVPIRRLRVTTASGKEVVINLPDEALGVSRFVLDEALIRSAQNAGAIVKTGHEVDSIHGSIDEGFRLGLRGVDPSPNQSGEATTTTIAAAVVVGAWGRRSKLDRSLRPEAMKPSEWVAFKGHYRGADVGDRIEMHAFPGGYCGMSHVERGALNACWILHAEVLRKAIGSSSASYINSAAEAFRPNRVLSRLFAAMQPEYERPLSVSQLRFDALSPSVGDILLVGDAAGMIAPVCGDGMSMALMSGIHVGRRLGDWFSGEVTMPEIQQGYTAAWRHGFRTRMRIGRIAHRLLTSPGLSDVATRVAKLAPALLSRTITATRGYPDSLR